MTKQTNSVGVWQRSLSVVIPALNEVRNLEPTVARLLEALMITVEDYEIIIINDGSTDGTGAVADRLAVENTAIRVIHHSRRMGLGYCYTEGYRSAAKDHFVYVPGDNTWPQRSLVELFGNMGRADIVTSFAINPESRPPTRRLVSRLYTLVLNLLFSRRLQYFNGLTIYPVDFLRREPATTFGFGFQAEVLLKGLTFGLSYIEVGLAIDERESGHSKAVGARNILSVAATILRVFWELRVAGRWQADTTAVGPRTLQGSAEPKPASTTVVIVGASSGIGAAIARDLSAAGYRVFACSRDASKLQEAFDGGSAVEFAACDAADEASVDRFVEFVGSRSPKVDALINCASSFGAIGPIDEVDSQEWLRTMNGNLFATFLTIKGFLPLLQAAPAPRVINMAGGGAFNPFPNYSAYACSKAAIIRLTETLAVELAPRGIAVNAIAPGLIPTPAHDVTIAAGQERAGTVQYRRTERLLRNADAPESVARMKIVQECVRALLAQPYRALTGKTISANFDPWSSEAFRAHISDINRSELYTMRRTNLIHLPEGRLRTTLLKAWSKDDIRR